MFVLKLSGIQKFFLSLDQYYWTDIALLDEGQMIKKLRFTYKF